VLQGTGGLFRVAIPGGELLCRARGRLRGRASAWRDVRDAERADGALRPGEEEPGGPESLDGAPAPDEELGADGPRRPARGGRGRGPGPGAEAAPDEDSGAATLLPGDRVRCSDLGAGQGVIDEVLPRRSALARPPIANPDLVVIVAAWLAPPFSASFVDRVLAEAALQGCTAAVCINKCDLLDGAGRAAAEAALRPFAAGGYPALLTSAVRGDGLDELRALLAGRLGVFSGPSGGGKSRLLAALTTGRPPRSAELSARAGRGRHTTRRVELLPLRGEDAGWVADTPGFSRLDLAAALPEDLPGLYPEFVTLAPACRFRGCLHGSEPECAVRAAAESGALDAGRYRRYLGLLAELRARPRRH